MRTAVILAGGGGTRLWPASRRRHPKQLLALGSNPSESLLAATVRRASAALAGEASILVVTASDQAETVRKALPATPPARVLVEPAGRDTAAAIGLAAVHVSASDPDAVLAIVPADQHISDEARFCAAVDRAFTIAETSDAIVTIGIRPTRPETGYGYLEIGDPIAGDARQVTRFVEKPDRETAERYLTGGAHLWNSGMFFARADRLLADLAAHLPDTYRALSAIADALGANGPDEAGAVAAQLYPGVPRISIDFGVMEKTSNIVAVTADCGWNDVGSWAALAEIRPHDSDDNVTLGEVIARDAGGNIAVADDDSVVALIGVSDLVVIKSGNAVLVVPRARCQEVRELTGELEQRGLERFL